MEETPNEMAEDGAAAAAVEPNGVAGVLVVPRPPEVDPKDVVAVLLLPKEVVELVACACPKGVCAGVEFGCACPKGVCAGVEVGCDCPKGVCAGVDVGCV